MHTTKFFKHSSWARNCGEASENWSVERMILDIVRRYYWSSINHQQGTSSPPAWLLWRDVGVSRTKVLTVPGVDLLLLVSHHEYVVDDCSAEAERASVGSSSTCSINKHVLFGYVYGTLLWIVSNAANGCNSSHHGKATSNCIMTLWNYLNYCWITSINDHENEEKYFQWYEVKI